MKKLLTVLLLTVLMVFCLLSCRQASTVVESPNQPWAGSFLNDYASRFDYFWRSMNSHYVFWDVDPTDWDAVYNTYLPKFKELDKAVSTATAEEREKVLSDSFVSAVINYMDMTDTLIDHHMNFNVFDPYRSNVSYKVYPRDAEIESRSYYHPRLTSITLESGIKPYDWSEGNEIVGYFADGGPGSPADGYKTSTNLMSGEETAVLFMEKYNPETGTGTAAKDGVVSDYCLAYDFTIEKKSPDGSDMHVIYLAMSNFLATQWLQKYLASPTVCPEKLKEAFEWKAGKTLITFFTAVSSYYNEGSLAGLILDNRNNSGGYNIDLNFFLGLYSKDPVTVAYSKYKEGFGKTDYSSEVPYTIDRKFLSDPTYGPLLKSACCDLVSADIPYIVLCDLNSVSNGEISTAGISSMKNGYVIGERTWGGTGPLRNDPSYLTANYCGTFGDETKGPIYCFTSVFNDRTYTKDGYKNLEGIGVTPDKEIYYKSTGEGNLAADVQTMLKSQVREAFSYIAKH